MFTSSKIIRFAHCDPAGIVFYPRYAEFCNEIVEDWFRDALGVNLQKLKADEGLTIPAVRLDMEFLRPSFHEDVLKFTLAVTKLGSSSIELSITAHCDYEQRIAVKLKIVMIKLESMRSEPISAAWRDKISAYLV